MIYDACSDFIFQSLHARNKVRGDCTLDCFFHSIYVKGVVYNVSFMMNMKLLSLFVQKSIFPSLSTSRHISSKLYLSSSAMMRMSSSTPLHPPHPPLVDVDCNLLHPDLLSIMRSVSSINVNDTVDDSLKILHHPSTSQANIIAIISPSSTIDESERSVSMLLDNRKKSSNSNNIKIKTTVGVHPYHTFDEGLPSESHFRRINELISSQLSS